MTTKTITTKNGKTVTVEMVREVQDKVSYADGLNIATGREIVSYTTITLRDQNGKYLTKGSELETLSPRFDKAMMAKGAVGQVGDMYLAQEMYDLIAGLLAEVEAETPKSAEQIEIENAKAQADAEHKAWLKSDEQVEYRKFQREMNSANSDY